MLSNQSFVFFVCFASLREIFLDPHGEEGASTMKKSRGLRA